MPCPKSVDSNKSSHLKANGWNLLAFSGTRPAIPTRILYLGTEHYSTQRQLYWTFSSMITPSVIQLNIDQKSSPLYTCMCIFSFMINKRVQNNSIEQKVLTSSIAPGWPHTVATSKLISWRMQKATRRRMHLLIPTPPPPPPPRCMRRIRPHQRMLY